MTRPLEPDVSVVIPTLGRAILEQSLEALRNGETWPAGIIVVDQGRRADTMLLLDGFRRTGLNILHIPSEETGRSAGLNAGLDRVTTRWAAVTDDDCLAAPDWIPRMADALRAHDGAIVTGRVDPGEGEVVLSKATSSRRAVQCRPRLKFDLLSGGNMGIACETYRRVGRFDQDPCVRAAEDAEFAYRALRAGVPIVYAPEVVVRHLGWRTETARETQYQVYARSHGGFYGKYLRRGDGWIALRAATHFQRALRRWILGALRGDREQVMYGRAYVRGLLPGILAGWRSGGTR